MKHDELPEHLRPYCVRGDKCRCNDETRYGCMDYCIPQAPPDHPVQAMLRRRQEALDKMRKREKR